MPDKSRPSRGATTAKASAATGTDEGTPADVVGGARPPRRSDGPRPRPKNGLDRYFEVEGVPESGLEQVVLDAILDAGLPQPVAQHWVRLSGASYRLDLAYPGRRICVEVDGSQHRDDPDVRADDQVRQRRLEDAGWSVIRIRSWCFATDLVEALRALRASVVDS